MTPEHTKHLSEQASAWREKASENPRSRGASFFAKTYEGYAKDSQDEEALSHAKDAGELLDLRFIGPYADHGTIPLGQFLKIITPLNLGLNQAAHRLRNGKEAARVGQDVKDTIALKMAGTGGGSTRIFVTGDGREDLTGISLLGATLTQTFRLLNADTDDFYDAVDAVGGIAARNIGEALQSTEKSGMAAEFSWWRQNDPKTWKGTPAEIHRVIDLIESTKEQEIIEQKLRGFVSALAETGAIRLRIDNELQKVRFPLKLMAEVQRLTLSKEASLHVRTARYYDTVLKKDIFKHTLISVLN